jgi:copper chaperone CopZ
MTLEGIEDDLPGIRQISASYQKMQMTVEYDEAKVSEAQILEAVKSKGYTAEP